MRAADADWLARRPARRCGPLPGAAAGLARAAGRPGRQPLRAVPGRQHRIRRRPAGRLAGRQDRLAQRRYAGGQLHHVARRGGRFPGRVPGCAGAVVAVVATGRPRCSQRRHGRPALAGAGARFSRAGGIHLRQHRRGPGDPQAAVAAGQRSGGPADPVRRRRRRRRRAGDGVAPAYLRPAVQGTVAAGQRPRHPCAQHQLSGAAGGGAGGRSLRAGGQSGPSEALAGTPGLARRRAAPARRVFVRRSAGAGDGAGHRPAAGAHSGGGVRQLGDGRRGLAPARPGQRRILAGLPHGAVAPGRRPAARSALAPPGRRQLAAPGRPRRSP